MAIRRKDPALFDPTLLDGEDIVAPIVDSEEGTPAVESAQVPDTSITEAIATSKNVEAVRSLDVLRATNDELHQGVQRLVVRKEAEAAITQKPSTDEYFSGRVKRKIASILSKLGNKVARPSKVPANVDADFAFVLSGNIDLLVLGDVVTELESSGFMTTVIGSRYLNIKLNPAYSFKETLSTVAELGERYGENELMRDRRVLVDFSGPNTAKTMHVGHLRSTVIGQALINIFNACNATTYGINHIGDWGTQFGKLITGYRLYAEELKKEIDPEVDPVKYLAAIYAKIQGDLTAELDAVGKNGPLATESRRNFQALEQGDPEVFALWEEFRRLSLIEFKRLYNRLGVDFDIDLGESFYEDKMQPVIDRVIELGIAREEPDSKALVMVDKAVTAKGGDGSASTFLFRKSDGGTNYATRDVTAIKYRMDNFNLTDILYVVGSEQVGHLRQCFDVAQQMGVVKDKQCRHISFGMIKKPNGKKIASREGSKGLEGIIDELKAQIIDTYGVDEADAEIIATGTLVFLNFANGRQKDMIYDAENAADRKEKGGPAVQYAVLKAESILKNVNQDSLIPLQDLDLSEGEIAELSEEFSDLIRQINEYPDVVQRAATTEEPTVIASYLLDLAQISNNLISASSRKKHIIKDLDGNLLAAYNYALQSSSRVLRNGLKLLNIGVPSKM